MTIVAPFLPAWVTTKFVVELSSALFGLIGTWLMSRRYARQFVRSLAYALIWPVAFCFGRGSNIRELLEAKVRANRDVGDPVTDMVLGVNLLFWSFLLQLGVAFLDAKK